MASCRRWRQWRQVANELPNFWAFQSDSTNRTFTHVLARRRPPVGILSSFASTGYGAIHQLRLSSPEERAVCQGREKWFRKDIMILHICLDMLYRVFVRPSGGGSNWFEPTFFPWLRQLKIHSISIFIRVLSADNPENCQYNIYE